MSSHAGTPGSFEETLAKQGLFEAAVKEASSVPSADVLWSHERSIGSFGMLRPVATETRQRMVTLLGEKLYNEAVGEKTEKLTPQVVTNVVSRMAETNHGIHSLLEKVIKDPKDAEVTMPSGKVKLSTLIRDPLSKEARMLAWYMENVAKRSVADKAAAFEFIKNDAEAKKLKALIKARKLYDELAKDEENFDIGKAGAGPHTQIGRIERRKTVAEAKLTGLQATMAAAKPKVAVLYQPQIDRVEESIDKMDGEIYNLDRKRGAVKSKLAEFDATMKQVDSAFALGADRDANLNKTDLLADLRSARTPLTFAGGTAHAAHEYITDDGLRGKTDAFADALTKRGTQQPLARDALQRLAGIEYADMLKDMEAGQREAFLRQIEGILSTSSGKSDDKKKEEAKKEEKKEKKHDDPGKGGHGSSWLGSAWKSFSDYMMDDSKDLLGFDVKSKDSGH